MDERKIALARACLDGASDGTMAFPVIVGQLMQAGFDGYLVDFRRAATTYYLPDGDSADLPMHAPAAPVAALFDAATVREAIREARQLVAGYSYAGFCDKVTAAGCAGYLVSLSGRRVLYFGRSGETHTEHFPNQA